MSQAKVDKYKKEKQNRAKVIKKKKVKKVAVILVGAALVGTLIGYPLGKYLYKVSYEKRMADATISAGLYDYWFAEHWAANYADMFATDEELLAEYLSTNTDATATDADAEE